MHRGHAGFRRAARFRPCGCSRVDVFRQVVQEAHSPKPDATRLGAAVNGHWNLETSQHWVLNIAFSEHDPRQQRNGAANFAARRRFDVSLMRQEKTSKTAPRRNECLPRLPRPACFAR